MSPSSTRAVIDLGTNTFHLLIARQINSGQLEEIYRERIFVKLASEGIETIGPAPFERGINALIHFKKILDEYKCSCISAIGTAALRRAANGQQFIRAAREKAGLDVTLIDGDEEARLITLGVQAALPDIKEPLLIMDIGGGSTEYIIVEEDEVRWRQSFPIGLSTLYQRFHHSDPISTREKKLLETYLIETTRPLKTALQHFPAHHLAGAAGTFDVLTDMLADREIPASATSKELNIAGFPSVRDSIVSASAEKRAMIPGLPAQRVDMVVVALLLLDFTLRLADIRRVTVSQYALKEGVLLEQFRAGAPFVD